MSTLRRRRGADESNYEAESKPKSKISLESFDLYAKPEADSVVETSAGAGVSIVAIVLIILLVISELTSWLSIQREEFMMVDPVVEGRLRINFDLTFHALPCQYANVDAMDVAGEQQNGVDHDIVKTRLDLNGNPISAGEHAKLEHDHDEEEHEAHALVPEDYCGPCYAQVDEGVCCNSCDEVVEEYRSRGWDTTKIMRVAEQCIREGRDKEVVELGSEGCHITGYLLVNKVAGNFHIAMGETRTHGAGHIHQFNPASVGQFNVSHTIHTLSFGQQYPGMVNPLDNVVQLPEGGSGVYMYYLKVVPTRFFDETGTLENELAKKGVTEVDRAPDGALLTNQYSVSTQFRPAIVNGYRQNILPGIFFVYEISPFQVVMTEGRRGSFPTFVTGLLAILGGVISLARLFDAIFFSVGRVLKGVIVSGPDGKRGGKAVAALVSASASIQRVISSASASVSSPSHARGPHSLKNLGSATHSGQTPPSSKLQAANSIT